MRTKKLHTKLSARLSSSASFPYAHTLHRHNESRPSPRKWCAVFPLLPQLWVSIPSVVFSYVLVYRLTVFYSLDCSAAFLAWLASFISKSFLKGLGLTASLLALFLFLEDILCCSPSESEVFSPGPLPSDVHCLVMRFESQPLHLRQV
jgi:hypothetical protein